MYAVSISDEGDCYRCFPPDPGIETAALGTGEAAALGACEAAALGASASAPSGAGESALSGTESASAFLTFTLDSGASRSFFRDRTTLTPLGRPVAVSLADPSGGPILAHFSTVLPCPTAPSGTLSGLYFPSFSTNFVSGADLQDGGVHQFTPASQRVTHCTDARTGRHLARFTRRPGSSLYTLTTASPPITASSQVAASGQVLAAASRSGPKSPPCSCRRLSHETLLWHHRLCHPSLLRLRGMASRVLRAAPHSSQFPLTEAPLQTLHMDLWGPARVRGQGHERYFLLVVDDYSRYTTVFPLSSKGDVTETFTLPDSPQQNGIAERRIGMVMDLARWQFYHPTSRRVLSSQDVTFDESVPYYRIHPYRTPSLPPPPLFLVPDAVEPVEVTGDSGAAEGAEPGGADSVGAEHGGAESGGAEPGGAGSGGAEPGGATPGGAEPGGATPGGAEPGGAEPRGAEPGGAEPGGAEPGGAEPGGVEPGGAAPGGAEPVGAAPAGAVSGGPPGGLLELEVLRLLRVLVPKIPEVLVLGVLELLGQRVLLELELLRALSLRLVLSVLEVLLVLLEVLELEVLLALVLPLGVLVQSLL
ncbi:unnamed protein product [Closterium sp. NIES-65]|nr:unnamed protein product [Closterium sp. NIES-65]